MNKYGLKFDTPSPSHLVFGASGISMDIIQNDGDWSEFLPVKEFQSAGRLETYACVIFTILNCVEILIKKQYGEERNYSDRFLATVVGTRGGGSSPHEACEFLRTIGVVPQDIYPFDETIDTEDKFFTPLSPELMKLAKDFLNEWDFKHEFVVPTHENISAALQCSPLLITVSAWSRNDAGRYYRPDGMTDNHATTLFAEKDGAYRRVFDSYDSPFIKDVEWDALPMMIKRFYIKRKDKVYEKMSVWDTIISFFKKIFHVKK